MTLSARVLGVGLVGPGLAGWRESRDLLAGRSTHVHAATVMPSPEALPATERRRAGKCVKLALGAGLAAAADAGLSPKDLLAVFTSSTGDGENLHAICEVLASDDRAISPTRFHNSVHNAPAGYWGIATGAMGATDSLGAYDASFAAGLLEALGRVAADPTRPVVLVAYDAPYPEPLASTRPIVDSFAVGMVLGAAGGQGEGAIVSIAPAKCAPTPMDDAGLERLRTGNPAARALPLLHLLAAGKPGRAALAYLDDLALEVEVAPPHATLPGGP